MNNHLPPSPEDIEAGLRAGRPFVLRADERSDMKDALLAFADFHQPAPAVAARSYAWLFRAAAQMAVFVLVVVGGTSWAAYQSLPGEAFYPMKVEVVEPLAVTLQYPNLDTVAAQSLLIERRFAEMATLHAARSVDDAAAADVVDALAAHSEAFTESIGAHADIADTNMLQTIDKVAAMLEAHQVLLELDGHTMHSEAVVALTDDVDEAYDTLVDETLDSGATTTIATYIDATVTTIEDKLDDATYSSSTIAGVEETIADAAEVIDAALIDAAAEEVSAASQLLMTEAYLESVLTDDEVEVYNLDQQ